MRDSQIVITQIELCTKPWLRIRKSDFFSTHRSAAVWVRAHMHESTLPRALKSIEGQAGFKNIEVNIIVHGSTDRSEQIAYEFQNRNALNTTIYTAKKDGPDDVGQSFRKLLIGYEYTDWHCFLPGDDYWLPGKISAHEEFVSGTPDADFYCHRTYKDLTWKQDIEPEKRFLDMIQKHDRYSTTKSITQINTKRFSKFVSRNSIGIESSFYHRSLVDLLNVEFILHPQGDLVFDILCVTYSKKMYFLDRVLTVYEVGRHPTGWNVLLQQNAEFDEAVTSANIKLLSNLTNLSREKNHVSSWAICLQSKLIAQIIWRRKLSYKFKQSIGDNPLAFLRFSDYGFAFSGIFVRKLHLTKFVFRLVELFRRYVIR